MTIDLTAKIKTTKEFMDAFRNGDEKKLYDGKSLIISSLANTKPDSRYEISSFLLEKNIDVLCKTKEQETALHVLLGQIKQDIPQTCELCRQLIKRGVDINAKDKRGQMAIQYIARMPKPDEELKELYDIWFAEPNLDLTSTDFMGRTPLEFAEGLPERAELVERMKKYDGR